MEILFQDESILVVHKPAGLASQQTNTGEAGVAGLIDKAYAPVNRLDQRVSGILLFAKQHIAALNEAFQTREVVKKYRAVVANKPTQDAQTLVHWLLKDATHNKVKAFNKEVVHSKRAELDYRLIQSSERYHLLDITLYTGRFHQVRAQLAAIGSPIVGDVKYGYKRTTPDGSIFLQSYLLAFQHPATHEPLSFEIPMPEQWQRYGFQ